ncbi:MAG TPA: NAD-glutamate dehydrogenase [Mycobacteriales bacterium]|nr:NAD-glutamate dehydrogenase [Mycobacteriales bacterium]
MTAADRQAGSGSPALDDLLEAALHEAGDHGQLDPDRLALLAPFLRQYYRFVAPEDLLGREPRDVYGAALAHLELAEQRTPGTALVRVLTPTLESHGWSSAHTVVEVVTDDMPFLVDTVSAELNRHDLGIQLVIHPVVPVRRDAVGRLLEVDPAGDQDSVRESFMHVEVDRLAGPAAGERLRNDLRRVLEDVRAAVEDWDRMRTRLDEAVAELPPGGDESEEIVALAGWMDDDAFTFLGYREYALVGTGDDRVLESVPGTGLGILRDAGLQPVSRSFAALPPEVRRRALDPSLLTVTKANSRATVHRPAYLDYVGIKRLGPDGLPVGERRFLGLFSHSAYSDSVTVVPVVRRKLQTVMERSGFNPGSHDYRALLAVLEDYPRDELFQISEDDLLTISLGILHLQERRQVRLFVRHDDYGRFVSCFVFLPRERYTTANRLKVQQVLMEAFGGVGLDHAVRVSESVLARLHIVIRTAEPVTGGLDVAAVEDRLEAATRSWNDALVDALRDTFGEVEAAQLQARYGDAFPEAYKEDFPASAAVPDLQRLEGLGDTPGIDLQLYRPTGAKAGEYRFKVFRVGPPLSLSAVMPLLQDMGVEVSDERPYSVERPGVPLAWVYDFGLRSPAEAVLDEKQWQAFEDAFAAVWHGRAESDALNALVVTEGMSWREVVVLRCYAKYLRQVGTTFSEAYLAQTLVRNPHVARQVVDLFGARFDPSRQGEDQEALVAAARASLDEVASLDEDRILRSFLALVGATTRTSFYQREADGAAKPYVSVKLDPAQVPDLPRPRPRFEIFVYSPRVEGVHLRFGAVARGGLRWSDRREDFRTEVLGLVKAQMVKNAVIVPVGSKGGFVLKRPADPADRDAWLAEGIACYRTFIHALLDVTDNIVDGQVVPPADVVRHDGDDPYLVVAADKGTATFSDLANEVAIEHGFWLGDAFASGGSAGYDHKDMGITARGAWESVKRHFRELGRDTQTEPFTVVGVGDMSGDVFGNGMLLSRQIRLVAAFDHRHVFLDPDPDPERSFAERERLFALPRSSWADYDPELLSPGGGVFPRSAKSVPLSPQVQAALGVSADALTPAELMRAVLLAPVDLLWNGGIGTYVKASHESHGEVGDKANDAIRVNGVDLQCRVVGEGGNLGLTQEGRIEYALAGGRVNTDAIDNSAGVDCSDHEVNIKILLGQVVANGDMTSEQRNELLSAMTAEVAALVLRDNYEQNIALGNARAQAPEMLPVHRRHLAHLEKAGLFDRAVESLPDEAELETRAGAGGGLTSPEFAVLLAWTKIGLTEEILASDVPEDPYLGHELERYFPEPLRERFRAEMENHRLRREIIATVVVNKMVNHAGITFAHRMAEEVAAPAPDIVRAHTVATQVFSMPGFWREVEALDNVVPTDVQTAVLLKGRQLVERATRWLLTTRRHPIDIAATVQAFAPGAALVTAKLPGLLGERRAAELQEVAARYAADGVPEELALQVAGFPAAYSALDVVEVAGAADHPVEEVAALYFALDGLLELGKLRERVVALPRNDRWQTLARAALRDDLNAAQAALTAHVLATTESGEPDKRIAAWVELHSAAVGRAAQVLADIVAGEVYDVATLSVALRQVRGLTQTSTTGET